MANVDTCVRECEAALCDDLELHAQNILKLPTDQQVRALRGKNLEQIISFLNSAKQTIQTYISNNFYEGQKARDQIKLEQSPPNNRKGADVFHKLTDGKVIDIEVKFGFETNKAIGMAAFSEIFGTLAFSEGLSNDNRHLWRRLLSAEKDEAAQEQRLITTLSAATAKFNETIIRNGNNLSFKGKQRLEQLVLNNSGDGEEHHDYYLKFIVEGSKFRDIQHFATGVGSWQVAEVDMLQAGKRVAVVVSNRSTNLRIKFVLNWKNDYKLAGYGKVSAKLGLGSPSWNVWVVAAEAVLPL